MKTDKFKYIENSLKDLTNKLNEVKDSSKKARDAYLLAQASRELSEAQEIQKRNEQPWWMGRHFEIVVGVIVAAAAITGFYFKYIEPITKGELKKREIQVEIQNMENKLTETKLDSAKEKLKEARLQLSESNEILESKEEDLKSIRTNFNNLKKIMQDRKERQDEQIEKYEQAQKDLKKKDVQISKLKKLSKSDDAKDKIIMQQIEKIRTLEVANNQIRNDLESVRAERDEFKETGTTIRQVDNSEIILLSIAKNILADGGFYDGTVYLTDKIDAGKINRLSNSLNLNEDQKKSIHALIDTTLTGSAVNGLLFFDCHFSYSDGKRKGSVSYKNAFLNTPIEKTGKTKLLMGENRVDVLSGDLTADKVIETIREIKTNLNLVCSEK